MSIKTAFLLFFAALLGGCGYIDIRISGTADLIPADGHPRNSDPYLLPSAPPYNLLKSGDVQWTVTTNASEVGPSESYVMGIEIPGVSAEENKYRNIHHHSRRLEVEVYVVSMRSGIVVRSPSGLLIRKNGDKFRPTSVSMNVSEYEGVEMGDDLIKSIRIPLVKGEDPMKWSGSPRFKFVYDIAPDPYDVYSIDFGDIDGEKVVFYFSPKVTRVRNFR
jgi:hypothetical protein